MLGAWPATRSGVEAELSCPGALGFKGTVRRVCGTDASPTTWQPVSDACVEAWCESEAATNAEGEAVQGASWQRTRAGEEAVVTCPFSYSGALKRACGVNGWAARSSIAGACVQNACGPERVFDEDGLDTGLFWRAYRPGQSASVSMDCHVGYEGKLRRRCSSGTWYKVYGKCVRSKLRCPAEPAKDLGESRPMP